jgi:drug/metabolite transporter (DMT)-like permease
MILSPELTAITFGLLSAVSWGAGDFSGGVATRRSSVVAVVAISHSFGLLLILVLALLSREPMPPVGDLLLGSIGGISGVLGLAALYRALAGGHMGIAAPVSAVLTAALPVLFSLFTYGMPENSQIIGFIVALFSVVLISYAGGELALSGSIGMAVLAGIGFGVFFIVLDQIQSDAVFWPLVAARATTATIMTVFALANRRAGGVLPNRRILSVILVSSVLDVGGNVFFLMATQAGRLDVASVVSSLYPASTVTLAWLLLKERLTRLQIVGVVGALLAIALISA